MNWKGCGRHGSWPNLRYYPDICLEGLRKTMNSLSQDSRSPVWDLNPESLEHEAGVPTTQPRCVVCGVCGCGTICIEKYICIRTEWTRRIVERAKSAFGKHGKLLRWNTGFHCWSWDALVPDWTPGYGSTTNCVLGNVGSALLWIHTRWNII
jgi:hypothetical protein